VLHLSILSWLLFHFVTGYMGVNIFVLLLKEIFTTMLIQLVDCIFPDAASGVKVVYRAKDFEDQRVRRCVLFCHQPHNFFFCISLHFLKSESTWFLVQTKLSQSTSNQWWIMKDFTDEGCVWHFHEHSCIRKSFI